MLSNVDLGSELSFGWVQGCHLLGGLRSRVFGRTFEGDGKEGHSLLRVHNSEVSSGTVRDAKMGGIPYGSSAGDRVAPVVLTNRCFTIGV